MHTNCLEAQCRWVGLLSTVFRGDRSSAALALGIFWYCKLPFFYFLPFKINGAHDCFYFPSTQVHLADQHPPSHSASIVLSKVSRDFLVPRFNVFYSFLVFSSFFETSAGLLTSYCQCLLSFFPQHEPAFLSPFLDLLQFSLLLASMYEFQFFFLCSLSWTQLYINSIEAQRRPQNSSF